MTAQEGIKHLSIPCDSHNASCHGSDATTAYVLHTSAILPCNFRLNSLRNIIQMGRKGESRMGTAAGQSRENTGPGRQWCRHSALTVVVQECDPAGPDVWQKQLKPRFWCDHSLLVCLFNVSCEAKLLKYRTGEQNRCVSRSHPAPGRAFISVSHTQRVAGVHGSPSKCPPQRRPGYWVGNGSGTRAVYAS